MALHRRKPSERSTIRLSRLLLLTGRTAEAYATISAARKTAPQSEAIRLHYTVVKTEYAAALLSKTLHILKKDTRLENFLRAADLLRTIGQSEKAIAILNKIQAQYPDNWRLEFALGQVYFSRYRDSRHPADLTEALAHLRLARDCAPRNYRVLFLTALVCTNAGLFDEALANTREIRKVLPRDVRALALETQIRQITAATTGSADSTDLSQETTTSEHDSAESAGAMTHSRRAAEILLDRAFALESTACGFVWSTDGDYLASRFREHSHPCFMNGEELLWEMVQGSVVDAAHIGIGQLCSCFLAGTEWTILMRAVDDVIVCIFVEGEHSASSLERLLLKGVLLTAN